MHSTALQCTIWKLQSNEESDSPVQFWKLHSKTEGDTVKRSNKQFNYESQIDKMNSYLGTLNYEGY